MSVEISRRGFLGGLALYVASRPVRSYAAACGAREPKVAFGVLSDVHIAARPYMDRFVKDIAAYKRFNDTAYLEKAFAFFRDRGADGVAIAGDLADWGLVGQLQQIAEAWARVFPGGKGKDGRPVERLFALGNHDFDGWRYAYAKEARGDLPLPKEEIFASNPAGNWARVFGGEKYEPIWLKFVKGYSFVGAHWAGSKGIHAIGPFLAARAEVLKGERPFFYFQHAQPKNTCLGGWIWGHDDGCSTKALSAFPNAVAFSGHSHKPLTNELNVWQGAFTSIGTASLFSLGHPVGRENGTMADLNARQVMGNDAGRKKNQPVAIHGQFVRVYEDFIEIERVEFVTGKPLGPNLVIPLPATKEKPFLFATQAMKATVPAPFPEGAEVAVAREEKPLRGTTVPVPVVAATFPQTRFATGASRTADYEIAVEATEVDVTEIVFTRYLAAPSDLFPISTAAKRKKLTFRLAASLLPKGVSLRFIVRGRETFGKLTAPIYSAPFML